MTKLSHIDLNVSDYAKSIRFYDMIASGSEKVISTKNFKLLHHDDIESSLKACE
jgi:catechol 2,3-dioxygenase-like lactoylglutathione lyase family enzyme